MTSLIKTRVRQLAQKIVDREPRMASEFERIQQIFLQIILDTGASEDKALEALRGMEKDLPRILVQIRFLFSLPAVVELLPKKPAPIWRN